MRSAWILLGIFLGHAGCGGENEPCVPKTCSEMSKECGAWDDGCGKTLACGVCPTGKHCESNRCIDDGCVVKTCAELSLECGDALDNCGGTIHCPVCPQGKHCESNRCIDDGCVVKTCAELSLECGDALDNCGGTIHCPVCPQGKRCESNRCVAASDPSQPDYAASGVYHTTIQPSGEAADVYYPDPPDLAAGNYRFPWALLVQGAYVDKQYYADFAARVARYGIVVVVPNTANLFPGENIIEIAAAHMSTENSGSSPIAGKLDLENMFLLGHSQGGLCSVAALSDKCSMWTGCTCTQPFTLPAACKGGVFYGTYVLGAVPNAHRPIALMQGSVDSKCRPSQSLSTYQNIADPPKAYITVSGANHYGICNQNNPPGAQRDSAAPTLDQAVAVETIARWSALFLRGAVLGEAAAATYVFSAGDALDSNVTVTSQR